MTAGSGAGSPSSASARTASTASLLPQRLLVSQAELVVGGERHLAFAGDIGGQAAGLAVAARRDAIPGILARRGRRVCVLASGDPFFYGVGGDVDARISIPPRCSAIPRRRPSAWRPRGWAGRCRIVRWSRCTAAPFERIVPLLQPGARILALSWDGDDARRGWPRLLTERGIGAVAPHRLRSAWAGRASGFCDARPRASIAADVDPLNTVALEIVADRARACCRSPPACPTTCSSMTARSPSARSAP